MKNFWILYVRLFGGGVMKNIWIPYVRLLERGHGELVNTVCQVIEGTWRTFGYFM